MVISMKFHLIISVHYGTFKVTRIKAMITKDELSWMFEQVLPTSTQQHLWRPVGRICIMMLGLKGLEHLPP